MNLMKTQAKTQHQKSRSAADASQQRRSAVTPMADFSDNRLATAGQRALQRVMLGNAGSAGGVPDISAGAGTLQKINLDDGQKTSEAKPEIEIGGDSVITAVKVGGGFGHTQLFFEHQPAPEVFRNYKIELTASGRSATTSSTTRSPTDTTSSSSDLSSSPGPSYSSGSRGESIGIKIVGSYTSIKTNLDNAAAKSSKKVTNEDAKSALDEADRIHGIEGTFRYETMATERSFKRKKMNCASFAEQVLRASGHGVSASGTLGIKTPGKLVSNWK